MAATFVVEDGTGLADANSYGTVAAADQYHENYGNPVAWSGAAQAAKENALRVATQYLDLKYHTRWLGRRENEVEDNALDWPRVNAVTHDGFTIDSDEIPVRLQNACFVLALKVINGTTLTPDITNPGSIKRRKRKVDVLETEDEYVGGRSQIAWFREVDQMISGIITGGGSGSTLHRA